MDKPNVVTSLPHNLLEDWLPALRHTLLDGMYGWVVNERDIIVDATPDTADAAGLPISSYIGMTRRETRIAAQIYEPTQEKREQRLRILWDEGGSDTTLMFADLPNKEGHTAALVTTQRIDNPNGKKYLLNIAHDVTDIEDQLDYLRTPAFQGLSMIIVEKDGSVLAATDAAAQFCNPKLTRGAQLRGVTIHQTLFAGLIQREAEQVALSRATDKPAEAIEWLESGDGAIRPYAVSRIAFPKGRWMIVTIPVPMRPWLQKPPSAMVEAPNFQPHITPEQLEVLVDMEAGLKLEASAERNNCSEQNVSYHRKQIALAVGVDRPQQVLGAIGGTELGHLVMLYSKMVHPEGRAIE